MKKTQIAIYILIVLSLMLVDILAPDKAYDEIEKKNLTEFSDLDFKDFFEGDFSNNLNDYIEDQIYLKDELRVIKSFINYYIQLNPENKGIYALNSHLYERVYPRDDYAITSFKETIKLLKELVDVDGVYVIPDKSLYLDKYLHLSDEDFEDLNLLYDILSVDDYYKTDLHLTHQGAYKIYKHLIDDALDLEFEEVANDFKGYYYNKSMYNLFSDRLFRIKHQLVNDLTLCKLNDCYDSVYFEDKLKTNDKYQYYSGGVSPITEISNQNGEGELVMFSDSYGQSLSIFMGLNYSKVTVIDLRLISLDEAIKYVNDDSDVICIYGLKTINDGSIRAN